MATSEQIASLRRMADEPTEATYTEGALSALIDAEESVEAAAAVVWREKAAKVAVLVQTSESGSSRANQQIHSNFMKMAEYYDGRTAPVPVVESDAPFTVEAGRG